MTEAFIRSDDLDYGEDDQVGWATARIREYCRWHIYPSVVETRTGDSAGGPLLVLPTLQLTALGTVTTHTTTAFDTTVTDTVVDPAMLSFTAAGVVRRRDCAWPPYGFGTITVTFTHGYDDLPEGIRGVAVAVARRIPRQFTGATVEAAGGVQLRYDARMSGGFGVAGFTADEQAVLDAYRIPPRP